MIAALCVALGGSAGGLLRYALSGWISREVGETFPWGTLVVNVTGCFVIGTLAPCLPDGSLARAVLLTGVLGGYTTVSSFSFQTLVLMRDGQWAAALTNTVLSLTLTLAAAFAGLHCAQALSS